MISYKIRISGTKSSVAEAQRILATTKLSGIEICDRIVLQKVIDQNNLDAHIYYNNERIFGYERIAKNLKNMQASGNITEMSDDTYKMITNLFDFPRGNKETYVSAYEGSCKKMLNNLTIFYRKSLPDINRFANLLTILKIA